MVITLAFFKIIFKYYSIIRKCDLRKFGAKNIINSWNYFCIHTEIRILSSFIEKLKIFDFVYYNASFAWMSDPER